MHLQVTDDGLGEGDDPPAGVALRFTYQQRAVLQLLGLLDDVNLRPSDVELAPTQRAEFPEPQAGERRQKHHRPETRLDRIGEGVHLLDRRDRPLGGVLDAGAFENTGVLEDELVLHGCRQDRPQQPVALRHRRPARLFALAHLGMPAADSGAAQLPQLDLPEDRQDVKPKLALVELTGPRS